VGRVAVLSDSLVNKIAAGEVIERPSAVIKELVENSLDAGSGRILVQVEGGGRALLRVVDDGVGMDREDARAAMERHATSKIRDDRDLFAIRTLGFRGEALPSIAEVSRFELLTGARGDAAGTRLVLDGGVWERIEDAPNPGGTDISVRRLFFNTPVRLKFLKAPRTELGHIGDVVQRMALAHPEVGFRLEIDGRQTLDVPPAEGLRERVARVLGRRTAEQMVDVGAREGEVRVEGLAGTPALHRSGNGSLYLYVNGRGVRDRTLVGAVLAAYRGLVPPGRYPVVVLFLDLPPEEVDVNVHPTKVDVRFQHGRDVFRVLGAALTAALVAADAGPPPELFPVSGGRQLALGQRVVPEAAPLVARDAPSPSAGGPAPGSAAPQDRSAPPTDPPSLDPLGRAARAPSGPPPPTPGEPDAAARSLRAPFGGRGRPGFAAARALGAFRGRWLLAESAGELLVVDAVAAHQRVLFDRLRRGAERGLPRQRLLVPELLELEPAAAAALDRIAGDLAGFGLEVSAFGGGTLALQAVPRGAHPTRCRGALTTLADRLLETPSRGRGDAPGREVPAVLAAWLALDPAEPATEGEQRLLLAALGACEAAHRSPWGRPVVARFGEEEVARWPKL
jgi:DNA mismatch repair protein MutL